uniref:Uncharacterized protein n=1 Tax=Anguilla anguilla TaxID=7936 RepID=A0A0E9SQ85_ANGAN
MQWPSVVTASAEPVVWYSFFFGWTTPAGPVLQMRMSVTD